MANGNGSDTKETYAIKRYETPVYPLGPRIEPVDISPDDEFHMRDYVSVVLKRKKVVIVFLAGVVLLTLFVSLMTTPVYRSTVSLKIDKETSNALSVQGIDVGRSGADYYQTQYELLVSRVLAERVVRKLALDREKDFLPAPSRWTRFGSTLFSPFSGGRSEPNQPTAAADAAKGGDAAARSEVPLYLSDALLNRLKVTPVKNSQLVKVSFAANSPDLSASIANAVAEEYIAYDLDSRINASKQARDFLEKQAVSTRQKVEDSERKLNDYASRNAIIFVDSDKVSINNQKLSELSASLSAAAAERIQKESVYRQIREGGTENPVILNNGLVQGLAREHATIEAEYYNLSKTYTADYPKMKNLKSQMDAIRERMEREKSSITRSLESDYQAALRKEGNLTRAFESQKQKVLDFQQKSIEYLALKREVDVNKELHNTLLQKLNQMGIAAMSTATNIQIVDKALTPKFPFKPNIVFNLLFSLFAGFAGGIGLAFALEYFDNSIKDTRDIEQTVGIPTLGMIPQITRVPAMAQAKMLPSRQGVEQRGHRPIVFAGGANGPVSEAFRSVGTFILLSSAEKPPKTILVTSCEEKVGKSTVSVNTAMALCESLGKGIIIDADLRRPRLHHVLGIDNSVGLSSFLSGNVDFASLTTTLIKQTKTKGLSFIPSGPVPPNPSELIISMRMQDLLDTLCGIYDFIIIDSAPVMGLADPVFLSTIVDGTVLVVKSGETPRKALVEAKKIFRNINAKILGVVLNGVREQDLKYGNYNYYYSSYFKE